MNMHRDAAATSLPAALAGHLRQVCSGGNWTEVGLKDALAGVTREEAVAQVNGCNSMATLVFHIRYYVVRIMQVLQGMPLQGTDTDSFMLPSLQSPTEWDRLVQGLLEDLPALAAVVDNLPEEKLWETFADSRYGTVYRNLAGLIEHTHYHLGQIVLIRKILRARDSGSPPMP